MILQLENLEKTIPGKTLFSNLNLRLDEGERLALVGANGAGKTTLLNIISGQDSPDSGEVVFARDTTLGFLEQEAIEMKDCPIYDEVISAQRHVLEISEELKRIEEIISSDEATDQDLDHYGNLQDKFESMDGYTLPARVKSVLFGLGFKESDMTRSTSEFSGGWQMRIALAKLLVRNPDLLLLDEPTNHLDLESVRWLEQFLSDYPGTMIVVSHDRAFMDNMVNRVADISNGNMKTYKGNYSQYVKQRDEYIEQLKAKRTRQLNEMHRLEVFVERFRYKATKARQAQERAARLEKLKNELVEIPTARKTVHFKFVQPPRTGDIVVDAKGLCKKFGENIIYKDTDFKLFRGDKVALVGPNGSGKSTMLKMIAGALTPDKGFIKYGAKVTYMYYAQHQLDKLDTGNTVYEEIEKIAPGWTMGQIRALAGAFLFKGDDVDKLVEVLSGGEKSRLALAKMLVEPAPLLCLDEPTNHLDIGSADVLEQALKTFEGTILFITHDRHLINNVANKIVEILPGEINFYDGNYDYYLYKKQLQENASDTNCDSADLLSSAHLNSHKKEKNSTKIKINRRYRGHGSDGVVGCSGDKTDEVVNRGVKSKEQKRAEAEARNALYAATYGLKSRLAEINKELDENKNELEEIVEILGDPKFYTERDDADEVIMRHAELKKNTHDLEEEWLEISTKIEQHEKSSGLK